VINDERGEETDPEQRIIEELIDEHVRFDCDLVRIDDQTWAIHGSIAVDGEVILAEFTTQDDAQSALEQLSNAENGAATPLTGEGPDCVFPRLDQRRA
jgi:hypothetical protein